MGERSEIIGNFIARAGWADAGSTLIAGDASNRKYLRLTRESGQTVVVMDAPPDKGEDTRPFIHIAHHLESCGLSAPRILAGDEEQGFLLLEDLGDALYARVVVQSPALEDTLYETATDVLVHLHDQPPPEGLKPYDVATMTEMAALAFDWYAKGLGLRDKVARAAFCAAIADLLARHAADVDVLIQRDYHAENLLWLPERQGVARVGLLDFQDAMLGHHAYDLVSLLQDARRDVPARIETRMLDHYITATGTDAAAFQTAYRCLGAQRNLRILGVFARLGLRDGKPGYLRLIPRVWDHLQKDLAFPALAPLRKILDSAIPAPSPETLHVLKEKCPDAPHP